MRVALLGHSDAGGGAARATLRLHRALLRRGVESRLVVQNRHQDDPSIFAVEPDPDTRQPELDRLLDGFRTLYRDGRTPLSNTLMTFPCPGLDLADHPAVVDADVIHLHWVARLLSPATVARLGRRGQPLVWTLRDQSPFTGGCHYSAGCMFYTSSCLDCPQLGGPHLQLPHLVLAEKEKLWKDIDLTIVSLSRWVAETARKSVVFKDRRIEVIPNCIDQITFHPQPQAACRARLGIAEDARVVVFVAQRLDERRKNLGLLIEALSRLSETDPDPPLLLVLAGRGYADGTDHRVPCVFLGEIKDDETLAAVYGCADVVGVPSSEDNYPNSALEALSCGVPVVGFSGTGLEDLISDGRFGRLVPERSAESLGHALQDVVAQRAGWGARRAELSQLIGERNGPEVVAAAYEALFKELAPKPRPRGASPIPRQWRAPLRYDLVHSAPATLLSAAQRRPTRSAIRVSGSDQATVHVVIPTFNRVEETKGCLEDLRRQTFPRLRVIIADSGSEDGTVAMVHASCPGAEIVLGERSEWWAGSAARGIARALEMSSARGDLVLLLNNDARIGPDYVSRVAAQAQQCQGAVSGVVYDRHRPERVLDAGTAIDWSTYRFLVRRQPSSQEVWCGGNVLPAYGLIVPLTLLRIVGLRPELFPHHLADYDLTYRLHKAGFRLCVSQRVPIHVDVSHPQLDESSILSATRLFRLGFDRRSRMNVVDHWRFISVHGPSGSRLRLQVSMLGRLLRRCTLTTAEIDALANRFRRGEGVASDLARARRYYRLAALLGNTNAMSNLGTIYLRGEGVVPDQRRAQRWLRRATARGNRFAPYHLGLMYKNGHQTEADPTQAAAWFRLAVERGHEDAARQLAELEAQRSRAPHHPLEARVLEG